MFIQTDRETNIWTQTVYKPVIKPDKLCNKEQKLFLLVMNKLFPAIYLENRINLLFCTETVRNSETALNLVNN